MLICFCFARVLCFAWLVHCCIAPCYLISVLVVAPLLCFVGSHYHLLTALCWWLSTLLYCVLLMVVNAPLLCSIGVCHHHLATLFWCLSNPFVVFYWCSSWPFATLCWYLLGPTPFLHSVWCLLGPHCCFLLMFIDPPLLLMLD